jgi:hypothetical protein
MALLPFAASERIDAIVTDEDAPVDAVSQWRARGVEVVTAALADDVTRPTPSREPRLVRRAARPSEEVTLTT